MKPDFLIESALARFTNKATEKFQTFSQSLSQKDRRLSIIFSGYKYDEEPVRSYVWLISNFDSLEETIPFLPHLHLMSLVYLVEKNKDRLNKKLDL